MWTALLGLGVVLIAGAIATAGYLAGRTSAEKAASKATIAADADRLAAEESAWDASNAVPSDPTALPTEHRM